jgi:hypothetical protein
MTATNFAEQMPVNKEAWGHKTYDEFIENFFFTGMLGEGQAAIIEHIKELTKNAKGESGAWLHLIPDIHGGGVFGDNQMANRERKLDSSWYRVTYDQIRNGMVTGGRLTEMRSVINTRKQFRKKMVKWLAETLEDQCILTASGIGYEYNVDGSLRETPDGQDAWTTLEYASRVRAPSANRHFRWNGAGGEFVAGDTTAVDSGDTPVYEMLPELEALASELRLPPLRVDGEDYYVWLIHKKAMAKLWQDANFRTIVTDGHVRGPKNPIFKNSKVTMNNIIIKPYQRVYNTRGADSGSKWGATGTQDGSRSLLLGAQALAMVDLGATNWEEEHRDFNAIWALALDKFAGIEKPQFLSSYTNTVEDVGVAAIDHAL